MKTFGSSLSVEQTGAMDTNVKFSRGMAELV
jgi:hypothetical protein